jgi:NADH-quinone oxidoreductase subunit N
VFSLFYYVRVLKAIFIAEPAAVRRPLQTPGLVGAYVLLVTVPIVLLGMSFLQDDLSSTAYHVAETLFRG